VGAAEAADMVEVQIDRVVAEAADNILDEVEVNYCVAEAGMVLAKDYCLAVVGMVLSS